MIGAVRGFQPILIYPSHFMIAMKKFFASCLLILMLLSTACTAPTVTPLAPVPTPTEIAESAAPIDVFFQHTR